MAGSVCGARVLGLLFGTTGFLLNHRGGAAADFDRRAAGFADAACGCPLEGLKSPQGLGRWLKHELKIEGNLGRTKREPAHAVGWGDQKTMQPEQWTVMVASPGGGVSAEYWVGNGFVSVKRIGKQLPRDDDQSAQGRGAERRVGAAHRYARGSIILLSLTGVLLWTELNKRRTVGVVLVGASIVAAVVCGMM